MTFQGFPVDLISFFHDLGLNNNKEWFDSHRSRYERSVLVPSKEFVVSMGESLREIAPDIVVIPKVNGSLFRLNRDTRFSQDKTPFKTHMGIIMWQGYGKRMEDPGFYFHLEPGKYMVGVGLYMFPPEILERYRKAVLDEVLGPRLVKAVELVEGKGFLVGEKKYKRVPTGFPKEHERAELLKFSGLFSLDEGAVPDWVFTRDITDELMKRYTAMLPVQQWLLSFLYEGT